MAKIRGRAYTKYDIKLIVMGFLRKLPSKLLMSELIFMIENILQPLTFDYLVETKQLYLRVIRDKISNETYLDIKNHWNDEDYDSDDLKDDIETSQNADDFDEFFPSNLSENIKINAFNILKEVVCGNDNDNSVLLSQTINWNINGNERTKYTKMYQRQCFELYKHNSKISMQQNAFLRLCIVGAKNNKPLFTNLVDTYERQLIYEAVNEQKNNNRSRKNIEEYLKNDNTFVKGLNSNTKSWIFESVKGWYNFYKGNALFNENNIPHQYYEISNIVIDIIKSIKECLQNGKYETPFQIDIPFILEDWNKHNQPIIGKINEYKQYGGYDSDDSDPNTPKPDINNDAFYMDVNVDKLIGDVKKSMDIRKISYSSTHINTNKDNTQIYQDTFDKYLKSKNIKTQFGRFIFVVDTRQEYNDNNDSKYSLFIWKPFEDLNTYGDQLLPERSLCLTWKYSLFPNYWVYNDNAKYKQPFPKKYYTSFLYNTEVKKLFTHDGFQNLVLLSKKYATRKDALVNGLDGLKEHCRNFDDLREKFKKWQSYKLEKKSGKGGDHRVFTVSLHVNDINEIKIYTLYKSRCVRTMPTDIYYFWPLMFKQKKDEIKNELLLKKLKTLNIKDKKFEDFCRQTIKQKLVLDMMNIYHEFDTSKLVNELETKNAKHRRSSTFVGTEFRISNDYTLKKDELTGKVLLESVLETKNNNNETNIDSDTSNSIIFVDNGDEKTLPQYKKYALEMSQQYGTKFDENYKPTPRKPQNESDPYALQIAKQEADQFSRALNYELAHGEFSKNIRRWNAYYEEEKRRKSTQLEHVKSSDNFTFRDSTDTSNTLAGMAFSRSKSIESVGSYGNIDKIKRKKSRQNRSKSVEINDSALKRIGMDEETYIMNTELKQNESINAPIMSYISEENDAINKGQQTSIDTSIVPAKAPVINGMDTSFDKMIDNIKNMKSVDNECIIDFNDTAYKQTYNDINETNNVNAFFL